MQIAATNPISLDVTSIDQSLVAREKDILKNKQCQKANPNILLKKMIEGRLQNFTKSLASWNRHISKIPIRRLRI